MRFTHHSDHRNPTSSPYRPSFQARQQRFFIIIRNRTDDIDEAGYTAVPELFTDPRAELVQRDRLVGVVRFYKFGGDSGCYTEELFCLGWACVCVWV